MRTAYGVRMELIAYFWEQEDADAVAAELGGEVRRGRFHGEDDDEDHPWMVLLRDADQVRAEKLIAQHDGWLETETQEPVNAPPELPTAPKRFKLPTAPKRYKLPTTPRRAKQ
ncbi:hypothetical protein GCM10010522_28540 [Kribbella solani]